MNVLHNTADMMNTHSLSLHFMFLLHCNEQWWSCAIQETLVIMLGALLWEYQSNVISYNSFKCCKQTSHPASQPTSKSVNQYIRQPVGRPTSVWQIECFSVLIIHSTHSKIIKAAQPYFFLIPLFLSLSLSEAVLKAKHSHWSDSLCHPDLI